MVTIMPPQLPIEIAILIFLPYFVAVIAAIIYTNKQIKKVGNNAEEREQQAATNRLDKLVSPTGRKLDYTSLA